MSGELIFITGATAFVGSTIIDEALKAGYRIRGSVRREEAAKQLVEQFTSKYGNGKAEFVVVPDITRSEFFDGKLDGVSYIIHVASPLVGQSTNWKQDYIGPAVNGTLAILQAATKVSSVKRAVITSSIAALTPLGDQPSDVVLRESNAAGITVDADQDFESAFAAYAASKILADQATTHFLQTGKPHFSIVTIHPSFIFGRSILQRSAAELSGTNGLLWMSLTSDQPVAPARGVHVLDVAEAHLRALNPEVKDGAKFLVTAPQFSWDDAREWAKAKFPNAPVKTEHVEQKPWLVDTGRAEKELGFKEWRGWKEFVGDVVEQQLELM